MKNFYSSIFQNFLENNHKMQYFRNNSSGAVFAERFDRTIRDLLEKPVFEKGDSNSIDILPTITKQNKNRIHSSTELSLIEASLKKERRIC